MFSLLAAACREGDRDMHDRTLRIDRVRREITFSGRIYPARFNGWHTGLKHHHFIVWKNGGAARNALVRADVSDEAVLAALERLGARTGDNLTADAWDRRNDPESPDPDRPVQGTLVDVSIAWRDGDFHAPDDLFIDHGGRGFSFRVGGHRSLIPRWRSGCIVCLESCPGGRISNERYTLRDLATGRSRFDVRANALPNDGATVQIAIRIAH